MNRVYGLLVAKNEESRYLRRFIDHHNAIFDNIFVFDDESTDNTLNICADRGLAVASSKGPSFMEHEGKFRYNAWLAFEEQIKPTEDDWVFVIDADEFLVSRSGDVRTALQSTVDLANYFGYKVVRMKKNEVWEINNSDCYIRTDGFWDKISVQHLFKYEPNAQWNMKAMGCGSEPTYARDRPFDTQSISVLHFGYAELKDREEKYERYMSLDNHGHNPGHILSILRRPALNLYKGSVPDWVKEDV
jgi:glycosyltransferase involved in cell wall biosynthesis